jgi:hypothetical protein
MSRPVAWLQAGADRYAWAYGLPQPTADYGRIVACPVQGRRIGAAYMAAPTFDRMAVPSYEAFRAETLRQYDYLTRAVSRGGLGLQVELCRRDPYANVAAVLDDLAARRLKVWATSECGNPHPFLTNTENDRFRAVHDAFGHGATGRGFDASGEEAAWCKHSAMYSPLARQAMTTETRGQNCALVFRCDGAQFPEQKVALLPAEFADLHSISLSAVQRPKCT